MIQIAVRALTLKIYNVADEMIYQFMTTPPVSEYFCGLIIDIKNKCLHIDALSMGLEGNCHDKKRELMLETDRIVDDFNYLKDILCIPEHRLSKVVTENIVNVLILPMLHTVLMVRQSDERDVSPIICLCILSRLLQVFDGTNLVNAVGSALLFSCMPVSMTDDLQLKGVETVSRNHFLKYSSECIEKKPYSGYLPVENTENEWRGIFSCILSGNHNLMLASLMLLFLVAESKDLDRQLAEIIGFSEVKTQSEWNQSIFSRQTHKIVNQLLKVLASEPPVSVAMLLHTAWFLQKLLVFRNQKLDDHDYNLFKTSYELSRGRLCEEFNQSWFDYIPDTLRNEWAHCKTVLEESLLSKDPFFVLGLTSYQVTSSGTDDSTFDWQQMVYDVKVFALHLQLKPIIFGGDPVDDPLTNWKSGFLAQPGRRSVLDLSLANFGSEIALGSGIPCKIAFSGGGTRDIYVVPTAREITGKLLLVEQHPLHSRKGVVIAMAPLAGLNPKIDEQRPTWLHLQVRDFQPKLYPSENTRVDSNTCIPVARRRWILGFMNADVCKSAYSMILEETRKQRLFVKSLVAPLFNNQ